MSKSRNKHEGTLLELSDSDLKGIEGIQRIQKQIDPHGACHLVGLNIWISHSRKEGEVFFRTAKAEMILIGGPRKGKPPLRIIATLHLWSPVRGTSWKLAACDNFVKVGSQRGQKVWFDGSMTHLSPLSGEEEKGIDFSLFSR